MLFKYSPKIFNFYKLSILFTLLVLNQFAYSQNFTENANARGLDWDYNKDGGATWADFDGDGDFDLLLNTNRDDADSRSRLFLNDGNVPPSFTDVTATYAAGLTARRCERSAIWGDLNNDGYIDFIRNTSTRLEIYLNRGPQATYQDYSFGYDDPGTVGVDDQLPNLSFQASGSGATTNTALENGMNAEGLGLIDYDNDGWLDVVIENHNFGIDIIQNQLDGVGDIGAFVNELINDNGDNDGEVESEAEAKGNDFLQQITLNSNGHLGIAASADDDGDYLATADFNNDGYLDFLARKDGTSNYDGDGDGAIDEVTTGDENDLWVNDGDGTFSVNVTFGDEADNGNKGSSIFCDFDKDGDLDIFWTENGTNQIWIQDPINTFNATGIPATIVGLDDHIDGASCADMDNDGDIDFFLSDGSGESYLFYNTSADGNSDGLIDYNDSELTFTQTDINVNDDGEGVNLFDYDGDGDVDIYININGNENQLWESDFSDDPDDNDNFMKFELLECIDGVRTRPTIGGSVVIKEAGTDEIVSAIQTSGTSMGHGSQNPSVIHMGGVDPDTYYDVTITFLSPVYNQETLTIRGADATSQLFQITNVTPLFGTVNCSQILPISLTFFQAFYNGENVVTEWQTASEINNDFFTVERSVNGFDFEEVGRVQGAGDSQTLQGYSFLDQNPLTGLAYYRLKQTDIDGTFTYSKVVSVRINQSNELEVSISPNPTTGDFYLNFKNVSSEIEKAEIGVFDMLGRQVVQSTVTNINAPLNYSNQLTNGLYILQIKVLDKVFQEKLIIE